MLFGGYLPRHLDTSCVHGCVTFVDWESRTPGHQGVLPISDQKALILSAFACTPCPRISCTCSSGGGGGGSTVGISIGAVAVGIPSSGREVTCGPGIPESTSTSKFHFVPRASTVSSRLHCSPRGFLRTDLHFVGRCISSPPATTDPSVRQFGCAHFVIGNQSEYRFTKHAQTCTYGVPSKYWNGVLPSGRTAILESTNPA